MTSVFDRSSPEGSDSDASDNQETKLPSFNHAISETSFDNYFLQSHKPSRTSTNVFSSQIAPLSHEEFSTAVSSISVRENLSHHSFDYSQMFPTFAMQLKQGFNLLMYGVGSKRTVLNGFAAYASKVWKVHVVVMNAFAPGFALKDVFSALERVPEIASTPLTQRGPEGHILRPKTFFSNPQGQGPPPRPICIIIHSMDIPALKSSKFRTCVASLCSIQGVHVIASVDNIASPLLWSLDETFSRKPDPGTGIQVGTTSTLLSRSCTWLWHDVTTLKPYDFELHHADRTSLTHHGSKASATDTAVNTRAALMTEVAARHILVSVTDKAKKLFVLLGERQMESMDEVSTPQALEQLACEYSTLFALARENFVATNDTSLRALMGEFKDHGLVVSSVGNTGTEAVWIPLRKSALSNVITDLKKGAL